MIDYIKRKYGIKEITPLEGGYSFCDKYKADDCVLKIFDIDEYDRLVERMKFMTFLFEKGLKVPKIIGYGKKNDKCFQLVEYLKGETGDILSTYKKELQYKIGYEAGKDLVSYHTYEKPEQIDIYRFHKDKFKKIYQTYKEQGISFIYEKECLRYVNNNLYLLKDRPTYQLHGDYHPENMCFNVDGYVGAYDFERNKKTDYVREFERALYFTRQFSVDYVKGFLDGYEFKEYNVLKLYLVMSIFNSFVWASLYYPEQLPEFDRYSRIVVEDFDMLRSTKPLYLEG